MIVKASPDLMPRELGSLDAGKGTAKVPDGGGGKPGEFAELMKGPNRTERNEESKPGRESEGKRSEESEAVTPLNKKQTRKSESAPAKKRAKTAEGDDVAPMAMAAASVQPQAPEAEPDVDDVTTELSIEVVESPKAVRENAMADFLTKMQNEFGIEPEQIVEAFTKLSPEALTAPPEESAKEFLAALNLPQEKMPVAQELYSQMVSETGNADLQEKLDALDEAIAILDDSLEAVSDYELNQLGPAGQALKDLDQAADDLVAAAGVPVANTKVEKHEAQRAADDMQAQLTRLMQPIEKPTTEDVDADAAPIVELKAPTPEAPIAEPSALAASMVATNAQAESETTSDESFKKSEEPAAKAAKRETAEFRLDDGAKVDTTMLSPQPAPVAAPQVSAPASAPTATAAILDRPMTSDEEAANVKQILNQARLAVRNGGGEVEMAMNPEGVGRVRLKVSMDDGQVDIRMVAENESTKKMLEKGLGELKSSLAEHQIKVENLKVDVGSEIKKHMDQNQDHASRQQSWQAAQDFLGRFRDERNGFRRNFMENQGIRRTYGGGSRPEMTPAPAVRASSGTSKRLNVVA